MIDLVKLFLFFGEMSNTIVECAFDCIEVTRSQNYNAILNTDVH